MHWENDAFHVSINPSEINRIHISFPDAARRQCGFDVTRLRTINLSQADIVEFSDKSPKGY